MDWASFRALFPATREGAYLNGASYCPPSAPLLEALERFEGEWASGRGDWRVWEDAAEGARGSFARLLGVEERCVALLPTAASGVAQVAERLPGGPGANLVLGIGEFRSNLFGWMNQERRGFELRLVPEVDGRMPLDAWVERIDASTACVAVSSVQSSSGYAVDLDGLKQVCRERGARLFVDATQSAGVLGHDLDGIDYLAAAGYKWLLGPRGCAYLYVAPGRLDELVPLAPGWKSAARPYDDYYGPPLDYPDHARKLDYSLSWMVWVGAAAGIELLHGPGIAAVEARARGLAERFAAGLEPLGLAPLFAEAERAHVVGLSMPDPEATRDALRAADVIAAVRGPYLRVGFHAFNDETDVERALGALAGA